MSSVEQKSPAVHLGERGNEDRPNAPSQQEDGHYQLHFAVTADIEVARDLRECGHHHCCGGRDDEAVARHNYGHGPLLLGMPCFRIFLAHQRERICLSGCQ